MSAVLFSCSDDADATNEGDTNEDDTNEDATNEDSETEDSRRVDCCGARCYSRLLGDEATTHVDNGMRRLLMRGLLMRGLLMRGLLMRALMMEPMMDADGLVAALSCLAIKPPFDSMTPFWKNMSSPN